MDDVTIPADVARQIANVLRGIRIAYPERCDELADLLDPPKPSLRDEVADRIASEVAWNGQALPEALTDAVLAVVRRHVEALPWTKVSDRGAAVLLRDEVLQLLGAGDE